MGIVNTLHRELDVPVTAKFRVFPTIEKTVEYAKMLERAGAQILTCHGRLREQRGQNTVRASIFSFIPLYLHLRLVFPLAASRLLGSLDSWVIPRVLARASRPLAGFPPNLRFSPNPPCAAFCV